MRDIAIEGALQTGMPEGSLHDQSIMTSVAGVDQRYAVECEYLVGWQGPGPERARLIRELQVRDRKIKEALARRQVDRFPGR